MRPHQRYLANFVWQLAFLSALAMNLMSSCNNNTKLQKTLTYHCLLMCLPDLLQLQQNLLQSFSRMVLGHTHMARSHNIWKPAYKYIIAGDAGTFPLTSLTDLANLLANTDIYQHPYGHSFLMQNIISWEKEWWPETHVGRTYWCLVTKIFWWPTF